MRWYAGMARATTASQSPAILADRFLAIVSKPVIAGDHELGVGPKQLLLAGGHDGRRPAADRRKRDLAEIYLALSM